MLQKNRQDKVLEAFKDPDSYDYFMSVVNPIDKLYTKIMWGFKDYTFATKIIDKIDENFSGNLLDVPCGSGLFTVKKYLELKKASITCVDYSPQMIEKCKTVFKKASIINSNFYLSDVCKMPFENEFFDIVVCLNGIHSFPDKSLALKEIYRVLKPGGKLIGCVYIKDEFKRSDWLVNRNFVSRGLFTPPFYNKNDMRLKFEEIFNQVELWNIHAIACFVCEK